MSAPPRPSEYEKEGKNPLLLIPGVKIGKEGLEQTLEPTLRGEPGGQRVEVTAHGKLVKELDPKPDRSGGTVQLTIDADLHEYAARRIGDQSCSVVVIDVTNGDILAMPSMPSFDPNNFSDGISQDEWKMLSSDDHLPLVDKALESLYPSGSTIKPSMAMALLNAGIDRKQHRRSAPAPTRSAITSSTATSATGRSNMDAAVVHSCDIYFYAMCRRVGAEKLSPMVRSMGFGEKFDLPFDNQRYGTIPDPEWMMRKYHRKWQGYDTINMSIGQGMVLINPMQLAVMASRLATGKRVCRACSRQAGRAAGPARSRRGSSRLHPQGDGGGRRSRHGRRGQAAARRHPDGGKDRHGADPQSQRRANAATTPRRTGSFATIRLFMGFVPFDNPRYAAGDDRRAWRFRRRRRRAADPRHLAVPLRPQKAIDALATFEHSIGGTLEERDRAQDGGVARGERPPAAARCQQA